MAKKRSKKGRGGRSATVLKSTWDATLEALASAESEVQHQVKGLMKRNRLAAKDAQAIVQKLGGRVAQERKRALKELEIHARSLQTRLQKERKTLGRIVRETVEGALASLNIPTRVEVANLTRKVEELSRKIDTRRRR
ncbi:MAG TPA: phasin family protein [Vicinamibacteria bacterium]|jgi:hypothetical protein|nr:phasin family protein [Vicinamibacteria bacterium]